MEILFIWDGFGWNALRDNVVKRSFSHKHKKIRKKEDVHVIKWNRWWIEETTHVVSTAA